MVCAAQSTLAQLAIDSAEQPPRLARYLYGYPEPAHGTTPLPRLPLKVRMRCGLVFVAHTAHGLRRRRCEATADTYSLRRVPHFPPVRQ